MDDALVLMKQSDVPIVLQAINGFYKNLNFTLDTFEDKKSTFSISFDSRSTTDIFCKDTHTGQYASYNSNMLTGKPNWTNSRFISWNYFSKHNCCVTILSKFLAVLISLFCKYSIWMK